MREAYDELLLWEEHTWGAGESVTKPFSQVSQSHWNETAGFAYRAHTRARELRRDALQGLAETLPADDEPALVVVNPLSRQRDDMVTVTTREGVTARFVRDIPPLGVKVVPLDDGATAAAQEQPERATIIESGRYRIEVDPKSASIVSLVDKELGKEWVDSTALSGIAGVVYEAADPTDDHPAVTTHRKHFHPDTPGPRFVRTPVSAMGEVPRLHRTSESVTLSFDGTAPYLPCIRTSVTLYHRLDWIDVSVHLRKEENFDMEGVHVVFPFALERPRFLLESTGAVFEAGVEQLPDTSSDWYSIQHALGVTDGEASVLWATREAPLVQLGGFHTGEWARAFQPASGHVHAWLMNNLYFTNFKAAQGGELDVSFRFTTVAGDLDASDVRLWGEAFAAPGTAMIAPVRPGNYRWIDVSPDTVIAQVVTPTSDADDVVLRLRETAGQPVTAEITWLADGQVEVGMLDLFNVPRDRPVDGDGKTFRLRLQPHELASVALRRR